MITLTEDEVLDLKRILYWTRSQEINKAIRIDSNKFLDLIKDKENGPKTNTPKAS